MMVTSEKLLSVLLSALEQASDAVLITDRKGVVIYANPAFERHFGYLAKDLKGQKAPLFQNEHLSKEFSQQLWETILAGKTWRGRILHRHPNGHLMTSEVTVFPVRDNGLEVSHFVILERDVTWEQELEAYLQQVEKLEAVSQLAGGIAHEFNNILTAISGYAELLLIKNKPEGEMRKGLEAIFAQTRRASYLVGQLLDFSRHNKPEKEVFDLAKFLSKNAESFQKWVGQKIDFRLEIKQAPLFIFGSPFQFRQILFNLLINAKEAMQDHGLISILLSEEGLPFGLQHHQISKASSRWAKLVIRDTGPGIAREISDRIFEPFFSTKSEAPGLGLAQVYGIVREHEGFLRVDSQQGQGTTFEIYLPLVEKDLAQKELFSW